jgi:hypothetical protein
MHKSTQPNFLLFSLCLGFGPFALGAAVNCDPDPGTDMLIQYGDSVACVFEGGSDVDVFRFVGNAGDRPFIQLNTDGLTSQISLYDPLGAFVAQTNFLASVDIDTVVLAEDGIYTVVAEAHPNANNTSYTLELPCVAGKCSVNPVPGVLGYTAVAPCRIVDTRYTLEGAIAAGQTRHFHSYGDVADQNQAVGSAPVDYPADCPFALGEHAAAQLNVTVVPLGPAGEKGFASLWPWGESQPKASWINYAAGTQNIANAGIVKTTLSSGADPDFSVYASRNVHLVIDVLGYFSN